jgi:phenylalanyl-tRNA synthetase beta chain
VLLDAGFTEVITYSFVDPRWQQQLHPSMTTLNVSNPIASDMSAMRTSLWSGLLKVAQYNGLRQQKRLSIFETGLRFVQQGDTLIQEPMIAGLMTGTQSPEQWGTNARDVDFYDLKGVVENLIALTDSPGQWRFEAQAHETLHPGQSAAIYLNNDLVGWLGALHPAHAKALDCPSAVLFELSSKALSMTQAKRAINVSKFPSLRRDIALLVDKSIPVDKLKASIEASLGIILKQLILFDVYQGKGLEEHQRSIAFGMILQHAERTLEEKEIQDALTRTLQGLEQQFGAVLRK